MKKTLLVSGMLLAMTISIGTINVTAAEKPYTGNITTIEDLESIYRFSLEGTEYTLPCSISDFRNNGWEFLKTTDMKGIQPGMSIYALTFCKDASEDKQVILYIMNASGNAKISEECRVTGIEIRSDDDIQFSTIDGIGVGSARNEVEAIYGVNDGNGYLSYEYYEELKEDDGTFNINIFSVEQGSDELYFYLDDVENVERIIMAYYKTFDEDISEVSVERPTYLDSYRAPQEISGTATDRTIQIDGKVYTLPVPVSEFLNDGWEIVAGALPGLQETDGVRLTKGDKQIRASLRNESELLIGYENTYIFSVEISNAEAPEIMLPRGIEMKATKEELLSAYPEFKDAVMEDGHGEIEKDGVRYSVREYVNGEDYHTITYTIKNLENNDVLYFDYALHKGDSLNAIGLSYAGNWED